MPSPKPPFSAKKRGKIVPAVFLSVFLFGVAGTMTLFPLSYAVSFLFAAAAIVVPQFIVFYVFLSDAERMRRAFYFWSLKFSLNILLMAVVLRGLHVGDLLQAPAFVAGATAGVLFNVLWLAARPTATATADERR